MMEDCFTNPPDRAGTYNVSIRNVMTCCAIFWYFDGTNWETCSFLDEPLGPNKAGYWPSTHREGNCVY